MGSRGDNKQSYALYEELKHLRVSPEAGTPYIYKRLDTQVREWLNVQYDGTEEHLWDCWVSYQMLFFLAN